ncbi:bifunctional nuclease family protein [Capnocytophaga canimorsus]|uniref:bifunctional nuclease family protein n=1 Tax=Capnocytophaga canimorsus TaxID=28188 RepID=UPI001EDEE3CF|nr:bifunctional nuclease family protein [Capnocytophaga canimorsus]GJQ05100.1 hypothetical protein CAPN009_15150 [Capnocytophaga canimorsus]
MNLIRLDVKGITRSPLQKKAYVLILQESESDINLPIVIAESEAQSIAYELEKKNIPLRPSTHDLFKTFADTFQINILKVVINKLNDGVFHSNLYCDYQGTEYVFNSRTSDAVALALRFEAPIYTFPDILEKAGIYISLQQEARIQKNTSEEQSFKSQFQRHSLSELKQMLDECVENEDYEMAAQIRDEISKRSE